MADSIQKQIMDEIATRSATILTSGSFRTDIGEQVFRWKTKGWEPQEMPGISIKDPTTPVQNWKLRSTAAGGGVWRNLMRVEFQVGIQLADNSSNEAVAEKVRDAIADVYQMIGVDQKWNGLAIQTIPIESAIDLVQEDKTYGAGRILVDIEFRTLAFASDTQG